MLSATPSNVKFFQPQISHPLPFFFSPHPPLLQLRPPKTQYYVLATSSAGNSSTYVPTALPNPVRPYPSHSKFEDCAMSGPK